MGALRKPSEIKQDLQEVFDRIDAILALAQSEDRQMNASELKEIDNLQGAGESEGKIGELKAELERAQKLEATLHEKVLAVARERNPELFGKPKSSVSFKGHDGRTIKAYGRGDKMGRESDFEQVGEMVATMILGPSGRTPETIRNALTTRSNGGDVIIPDSMMGGFLDYVRARSVVSKAGAVTVNMDAAEVTMSTIASDPTIAEKVEGAAWTATNVVLGQVRLMSRTYGALLEMSREELEDSTNAYEIVATALGGAMAAKIDALALAGTGSQELTGLCYMPSINITGSTGSLTWAKLSAAATAIRGRSLEPNAAIMTAANRDALLLSADTTGQFIAKPATLTDVTLDHTTAMPSTMAIVGDFTTAVFGVRSGMKIEVTTQGDAFAKHNVQIKIVWRGDFGLFYPNAWHRLEGIS